MGSIKCPACNGPLREKNAAGMVLDICYGGCGGIWFDANELDRVNANPRAANALHSVWQAKTSPALLPGVRRCPKCPDQVLERKWFSPLQKVEIDQCPACDGIWLDAGEFTRIHEETDGAKLAPPGWAAAMVQAAACVEDHLRRNRPATPGQKF